MRKKRYVLLATLLLAGLVTGVNTSHGKTFDEVFEEGSCGKCYDGEVDDESLQSEASGLNDDPFPVHIFGDVRFFSHVKRDCSLLNACHTNSQVGTCEEWHVACAGGGDLVAMEARVSELAASRDSGALRSFLDENSENLVLDPKTSSVIVLDCELRQVAIVEVPEVLVASLSEG